MTPVTDPAPDPALARRIRQLAEAFVAVPTHTGTPLERQAEGFYRDWFAGTPYFRAHPDHCGLHALPDDPTGRSVAWALVRRGDSARTVILIHHYDTADVLDYGPLQDLAHAPAALARRMAELAETGPGTIPPEAAADLAGGEWLFGRGICDMKGGAAIEMALLEAQAEYPGAPGNLLLLGLPDEENLSAGMRGAIPLLHELRTRFALDFRLLVNTEPHMRVEPSTGVLYEGSVGKIMPVVYVKGAAAHAGQVFNGFNPILLLAEIIRRTELDPAFLEVVDGEATLPPTWLYCKDRKDYYDVSLPLAAAGYLNLLTLERTPGECLERLRSTCRDAFAAVVDRMGECHREYCRRAGLPGTDLPWRPDVRSFDELERSAAAHGGAAYAEARARRREEMEAAIGTGRTSLAEASVALVELALSHSGIAAPVVVLALAPPYYPSVCNRQVRARLAADPDADPRSPFLELAGLAGSLQAYARAAWDQAYTVTGYFNGLSDLSYAICPFAPEAMAATASAMPLWGEGYSIPFAGIRDLGMPVLNVGPWGKDFHKLTERVYLPDLCGRTPALVEEAVRLALA
jgi:arginine utilization protein RocB